MSRALAEVAGRLHVASVTVRGRWHGVGCGRYLPTPAATWTEDAAAVALERAEEMCPECRAFAENVGRLYPGRPVVPAALRPVGWAR